ncbi:DUF397 domain-containing protein [Pseudonocardia sp. KRD-184]|uniref:DUF397 domain-containing protein n=1 Tax=Pseudonocardia oceani TaxID=2792013 RepID=A0ABS6U8S8_9PSEU|nr:DUF397 domain-containing protein [Pseudonocardia oceani]MBW0090026.1 DUF397 domain-containing protein [Pseudonocardia oceani]MBW0097078.1 DUF397 domain-containing protein [Pseudonocardia oceani]MBW0109809.1 DUF397 domain-containing protein [Pseudonocardia oceani]MBW0123915.1 DUF397 domain-containing protein [Pseudonocardia oceani]MBW0128650.1 DUF397 domain-containing protein [Pseudonocardia oceani]
MAHTGIASGQFVKSSFSASGNCVEVRRHAGGEVEVRHSRHPTEGTLVFTSAEWAAFVEGVKHCEFDPA